LTRLPPAPLTPPIRFNPRPQWQAVAVGSGQACWVANDALLDAERLRDWAVAHRDAIEEAPVNACPGIQIDAPEALRSRQWLCHRDHSDIDPRHANA
jgi:hypothetical protein